MKAENRMKRFLLWLILAAVAVTGFLVYQARSQNHFNVTPDADREIEKAMHR
jgi:hypothetical protein